jgi:Fe-S oxidoreductase
MPEARENSLCCGGGGGRIWMETPKGERFSDLRLEQATGVGAEVLVTACPYCITHFEESRLMLAEGEGNPADNGNKLEIKDLTEIIHDAIF